MCLVICSTLDVGGCGRRTALLPSCCSSPPGVAMLPPWGIISITVCQSYAKKYKNLDVLSHNSSYEGLSFTLCSKESGWPDGMTAGYRWQSCRMVLQMEAAISSFIVFLGQNTQVCGVAYCITIDWKLICQLFFCLDVRGHAGLLVCISQADGEGCSEGSTSLRVLAC